MKIKEVEQRVGMKRANIRYYEQEGLLKAPERNSENNYREYSEEDVAQLQKIKVLRILGVAPDDIKLLNSGLISMEDVISKRTEELEKEIKKTKGLLDICQTIIERNIDIQSLNEDVLSTDKKTWQAAFEEILVRDIVKEVITRKQLNRTMAGMLLWGYFLSMIVTVIVVKMGWLATSNFEEALVTYMYPICFILAGVCGISVFFTASVKIHTFLFHICALILPFCLMLLTMIVTAFPTMFTGTSDGEFVYPLAEISLSQLVGFWLLIMVYVIILYFLSEKWEKMFTKMSYSLLITTAFSVVYVFVGKMAGVHSKVLLGIMVFLLFYISMNWTTTLKDRQNYNRYYAVKSAGRIMNLVGMFFGGAGRGSSNAWLK